MNLIPTAIVDASGLLVLHRREDTQLIQTVRNALIAHAADFPCKNVLHHSGGLIVNEQVVLILRVLVITVGSERPDELPVAAADIQVAADLDGRVPAVVVVKQIFYRNQQMGGGVLPDIVVVVNNGDKADVLIGELLEFAFPVPSLWQ